MAFEPGGYADKLGNRYEGRWVARQLLLLLCERIRSVTLESVGDDEVGVDLWVELLDRTREAQQCKAENGTNHQWTLKNLRQRGVLGHLREQIQREAFHRFSFVSSTPANQLRDLSRSASDSTGDPESFYANQIVAGSRGRQDSFSDFCKLLELNESDSGDRATAFDLLARSDFHLFADDREQREELRLMADVAVVGDPNAVLALLADFAADNLRRTLRTEDVWNHLKRSRFEPRTFIAEDRIEPRLQELRTDFEDSIGPHLAGGRIIPRPEVDQLDSLLTEDDRIDAIILHGAAGYGKSGVLYQFCNQLRERNTPFLALRLDRKVPLGSPREFGRKLGLPDSPVHCLKVAAGYRNCVLVLDQLDALRWTSSHASESLDVCKALLREAHAMKLVGAKVSIVLCCRTFDLEHDPQIRDWLRSSISFRIKRVLVGDLPEPTVREFVERFGVNFSRMTPKRQGLLQCVQNLAIWSEVVVSKDKSPEFDSGSDLLREFWASRRRELEKVGFSPTDTQKLLGGLIDYMETKAKLSAPKRLVEHHQGLATELQSLNVIHIGNRDVSFCHQSYLDFLIAVRALEMVSDGDASIIDWLGDKSRQSLFRREQLRQLLFLLADEYPVSLTKALTLLLSSADVRFHIKQLAIETIGQIRPTDELQEYVFPLLEVDEWSDHVIRDIIHGNADWMNALHDSGRLMEMLCASDESSQGTAAWLVRSVADKAPALVDSVLEQAMKSSCADRLNDVLLFSDAHEESDRVFNFRLACVTTVTDPPYVLWDDLAKERPDRAIKLPAACLQDWTTNGPKDSSGRNFKLADMSNENVLRNAATRCPKLATRVLTPILMNLANQKTEEHRAWNNRTEDDIDVRYPRSKYPKILLSVFGAAISTLARNSPSRFFRLVSQLEGLSSRSVQALLVRGWSKVSAESHADAAINWLLADRRRLRCGSSRRRARWCEAALIIRRMSPACSDDTFNRLEKTLLRYRDPDERRRASTWLRYTREGYYLNGFGAAAHFLLPALAQDRRCIETVGRIGVLAEKFAAYPRDHFLRVRGRGGMVRSPLGQSAIERMSDKQWLRLIGNREVPARDGAMDFRRYGKGNITEASVEMFSRDFGVAAKRDPERFGRLALRFPGDAPPDYLAEVFGALEETKAPNDVSETQRDEWKPASKELIEKVLASVNLSDSSYLMRRFCWLILKRKDVSLSARIISRLIELTTHPDPEVNPDSDESTNERIHGLQTVAINHVRSLAVSAIGSILYEHEELFSQFRPTLEKVIHDPHPAVRVAMVDVCLPLWNFDRRLSVDWFVALAVDDLWPACGHTAQRFLNCAFPEFADRLTPLITAMVESNHSGIAGEGAQEALARWLFFDIFDDLVAACRVGEEPLRKGIASVAVQFAHNETYSDKCWPVLLDLCDDPVDEIRQMTVRAVHDERILGTSNATRFLSRFLMTEAFDDDPSSLIDALHDYSEPLTMFTNLVLTTVRRSVEILRSPNVKPNRRWGMIDRHMSIVLLRMYEQADSESDVRNECLDAIDEMLKHRIAPARSLLEDIGR